MHVSPGVDDTYTSRNWTGHVFFSRMNPGFISIAATVVLECTVVLVNVSMTVVWFSGVLSAEEVSWCGWNLIPWKIALKVVDGTLTGIKYRDEIIRPHVLPFVQQHNATLQQDNARPHVVLVVTDFLIQNNVNVLPWPAMSPDLSPIEHVWDEMSVAYVAWKSAVDVTWPVTCACENLEWYSPGIFQNTSCINEASLPSMHRFQWWTYTVLMSWTVFRKCPWKLISIQDATDAITMSTELVLNKDQIKPWYILCSNFLYTS